MSNAKTADDVPIVQYWHSPKIPEQAAELSATFRDHNPKHRHRIFCRDEAEDFIAEHFTAREVAAFRACAIPAMQSDYFRYCIVLATGGVYSDVDNRCLRPLGDLIKQADDGLLIKGPFSDYDVTNSFFIFRRPGHALLQLALDIATLGIETRASNDVWVLTGPWIFCCLRGFHQLGSADGLRRKIADIGLKVSPDAVCKVAGDGARVNEAFSGVRMFPSETAANWVERSPLHYARDETHWRKLQKQVNIFTQ